MCFDTFFQGTHTDMHMYVCVQTLFTYLFSQSFLAPLTAHPFLITFELNVKLLTTVCVGSE